MVDYSQIIINFGQSLTPLSNLFAGFSYLLGLVFVFVALNKIREMSMARTGSNVSFPALCYLLGGAFLLYLPTYIDVMSDTFFGQETNPLAYYTYPYDGSDAVIYYITQMIQVGGLVFFVRGTVLLIEASLPGSQHGLKGLAFIVGGVMMMNYTETQELISGLLQEFYAWRSSSSG